MGQYSSIQSVIFSTDVDWLTRDSEEICFHQVEDQTKRMLLNI